MTESRHDHVWSKAVTGALLAAAAFAPRPAQAQDDARADLSPGPGALFTAFGGEHSLGGIPGYESRETTDERPQRVAAIQRLSTAYLRTTLYPGDTAWEETVAEVSAGSEPEGLVEVK